MDNYVFDEKEDSEEHLTEEDSSSPEEGFMKGYLEEEEVKECCECGAAIKSEKQAIVREVSGEEFVFCSNNCADEFEDSIG